jgi:hypothetical protein
MLQTESLRKQSFTQTFWHMRNSEKSLHYQLTRFAFVRGGVDALPVTAWRDLASVILASEKQGLGCALASAGAAVSGSSGRAITKLVGNT